MRTFAVVAALSIALSSCLASAALSEERLVMPFDCRAIGGDVELVPGPSQSYRIYGTPERQLFTACSPERPELCRSWMLHRFDIDCSGVRVSWLSVVDVLTKWRPNRVWVSDGRLHVRMGPWWKGAPAGPCNMRRSLGYPPWRYSRPGVFGPCAGSPSGRPQQVIDLPSGFAPAIGMFAHFVSTQNVRTKDGALNPEIGLLKPEKPTSPIVDRAAEGERLHPSIEASKRELPKNGPALGSTEARPSMSEGLMADPAQKHLPKEITVNEIDPASQVPIAPMGVYKISADKIWFGLVAMLLISAMWFALTHHDERIDGSLARREATSRSSTRFPSDPRRPRPSVSGVRSTEDSGWLPSTRKEALQVLGASPEDGEEMLKKIVKTLRQTWHPDRANREEERLIRERKLKQINVAWDIIRGKRASARGSRA